jgi:hypothetical protein
MKIHHIQPRFFSLALIVALVTSTATSSVVAEVPANSNNVAAAINVDIAMTASGTSRLEGIVTVPIYSSDDNMGSDYSTDPALFFDIDSNKSGTLPFSLLAKQPLPVRAFVDTLYSPRGAIPSNDAPPNYVIPHGTGPLRWSCVYNQTNVAMTPWGTQISITRSDGLPIPAPPGSKQAPHPGRPYNCGEMISKDRGIGYGKYSVDMVSTDVRGHVTALFLIAHSDSPEGGSEIDIELTGLDPTAVWLTVWKGSTQQAVKFPLGFDASKGWHTYSVEWQPGFIAWSVDGREVLRRTDLWTADPRTPGVEYKLALNSWTHDQEEDLWAGKFKWPTDRRQPVMSQFRNLRFVPMEM